MATAVFKATRDTTLLPATFDYTTVADTAIAGRDFQAISGTAQIPIGVDSVNIEIPIVDKPENSLSREFTVEFSNPSQGVRLQNTTAKCTITTKEDMTPLS